MAIAGAIGLAVVVAALMSTVQSASNSVARAESRLTSAESLLESTQDLMAAVEVRENQGLEASELIRVVSARWFIELLAMTENANQPEAMAAEAAASALRDVMVLSENLDPGDPGARLAFDAASDRFTESLGDLALHAKQHRADAAAALEQRRPLAMIVIGVLCLLYLALVEHTRHWTHKRIVRPVERLADAARRTMDGETPQDPPSVDLMRSEEFGALTSMISGFIDTLKTRVDERTAELEHQKEHLEREIVIRRRAENELRYAAFHDRLTGLCNRDLLIDRLDRCIARARRHDDYKFAVLFLDVDRFKEVNDSLGHSYGDELLIATAERIKECLRGTDTLLATESSTVARIGGDEFVVLLDGIHERDNASAVASRIQQALGAPFELDGHEVFTTVSIGIAFNEIDYDTPDLLLRDADAAMYSAKAGGKARHEVFNKKMHEEALARLNLSTDLRRAVEHGQFQLLFQPIVELGGRQLSGFEALVRWEHPERGLIAPSEFIDRAEETGLITQIGLWVLESACRELARWHQTVDPQRLISVSVNVSKRQIAAPGLVRDVARVLRETGLDGRHLKLEITESVIMANPDSFARVLEELKELGVEVHMDDFGTGYSSLSYLHRFPIDVLKIDREFMSNVSKNHDYSSVIRTVVTLAHQLNIRVTVEGVETSEHVDQLALIGCDFAQGYRFGTPLTTHDAESLIGTGFVWPRQAA